MIICSECKQFFDKGNERAELCWACYRKLVADGLQEPEEDEVPTYPPLDDDNTEWGD